MRTFYTKSNHSNRPAVLVLISRGRWAGSVGRGGSEWEWGVWCGVWARGVDILAKDY